MKIQCVRFHSVCMILKNSSNTFAELNKTYNRVTKPHIFMGSFMKMYMVSFGLHVKVILDRQQSK